MVDKLTMAFSQLPALKDEGSEIVYDVDGSKNYVATDYVYPTWKKLFEEERKRCKDDSVAVHFAGAADKKSFNTIPDYGTKPWTIWTEKRVYFPEVYDGSYLVESVPRDPCDEAAGPFGGGN